MMWLWTCWVQSVDNRSRAVDEVDPGVDGLWIWRSERFGGGYPQGGCEATRQVAERSSV
jgi:hypothetical protein